MTDLEKVDHLEYAVKILSQYAKVLKSEDEDLTGLGLWRIFCDVIEGTMDCKIYNKYQVESIKEMEQRERSRK